LIDIEMENKALLFEYAEYNKTGLQRSKIYVDFI